MQAFAPQELEVLATQLEKNINCPQTSSMGRLFDAVASLAGLRQTINYEAQAAMELENAITEGTDGEIYPFDIQPDRIDPAPLLQAVVQDVLADIPAGVISAKFHNSVVDMLVRVCLNIKKDTGYGVVALSGGVWQNLYLLSHAVSGLETAGFRVLTHRQTPPNDGCIALGQAVIANEQLK